MHKAGDTEDIIRLKWNDTNVVYSQCLFKTSQGVEKRSIYKRKLFVIYEVHSLMTTVEGNQGVRIS